MITFTLVFTLHVFTVHNTMF